MIFDKFTKSKIVTLTTLMLLACIQACVGGSNIDSANSSSGETSSDAGAIVSFSSGSKTLYGYLYKPQGDGPFPAVISNHGSESDPTDPVGLAKFYTDLGFVFFAPHRTGHGLSADAGISATQLIEELLAQDGMDPAASNSAFMGYQEDANVDVLNAIRWLKTQSFVEGSNLMVSGVSYGGIQTLLTAKNTSYQDMGIKAAVAFAPAAMSWNPYLAPLLYDVVQNATIPIFIIQAANDYDLGPSKHLGPLLESKGFPNRYKIFPAFGTTEQEGHSFGGYKGSSIWSADVLTFLKDCGM